MDTRVCQSQGGASCDVSKCLSPSLDVCINTGGDRRIKVDPFSNPTCRCLYVCLCFCLPVCVAPLLFAFLSTCVCRSPPVCVSISPHDFLSRSLSLSTSFLSHSLTLVSTNHSCLTKNTFRKPKLLDLVGKLNKETTKNSQYLCKNYTPFWSGGFSFWRGRFLFPLKLKNANCLWQPFGFTGN